MTTKALSTSRPTNAASNSFTPTTAVRATDERQRELAALELDILPNAVVAKFG